MRAPTPCDGCETLGTDPTWITALVALVSPILAAVWVVATISGKVEAAHRLAKRAHERIDTMLGIAGHQHRRHGDTVPRHWEKADDEGKG